MDHFQKLIESEKERVERDFHVLGQEIENVLKGLKLSIMAQLDFILQDFLTQYGELKHKLASLRQLRRQFIQDNHNSRD